jgi:hypothetical protein
MFSSKPKFNNSVLLNSIFFLEKIYCFYSIFLAISEVVLQPVINMGRSETKNIFLEFLIFILFEVF